MLWPVLRYSDERGAWVLRLVGERVGPVLVGPEVPISPAPLETGYPGMVRRRGSWIMAAALVTAALVAAAALLVVRGGVGSGASGTGGRTATASGLQLAVPSSWRRPTPAFVAGLGLSGVVSVAPSGSPGGVLVVGRASTPDPQLLPRPLLASLRSAPTPQAVTLGSARFFRYGGLTPRGQQTAESVYSLPTTAGTVVGICRPAAASSLVAACEHTLAGLRLTSGQPLPLGPEPQYASLLNQVVSQLNAARRSGSAALAGARTPSAQASAADSLAAAHSHAAGVLSKANAGTASGANAALVSALGQLATGYRDLARAASRHDAAAYKAAGAAIQKANGALTAAYAGLSTYGYTAG